MIMSNLGNHQPAHGALSKVAMPGGLTRSKLPLPCTTIVTGLSATRFVKNSRGVGPVRRSARKSISFIC